MSAFRLVSGVTARLPTDLRLPPLSKPPEQASRCKLPPKRKELTEAFVSAWEIYSKTMLPRYTPTREYQFHPTRRWRFDAAFPSCMVAVEFEGGIWTKGRHTRGAGFRKDCEKYNAATAAGWRVLRFVANDLEDPVRVCEQVTALLNKTL